MKITRNMSPLVISTTRWKYVMFCGHPCWEATWNDGIVEFWPPARRDDWVWKAEKGLFYSFNCERSELTCIPILYQSAGMWFQVSALPLAWKADSQIGKETLKKRISNIESWISNVEGMYSVYFIKRTEWSETILRNSAVRYSMFCGSLFIFVKFHTSAAWPRASSLIKKETFKM